MAFERVPEATTALTPGMLKLVRRGAARLPDEVRVAVGELVGDAALSPP